MQEVKVFDVLYEEASPYTGDPVLHLRVLDAEDRRALEFGTRLRLRPEPDTGDAAMEAIVLGGFRNKSSMGEFEVVVGWAGESFPVCPGRVAVELDLCPPRKATVRDEHFHKAGDGRPPRRVFVDGVEIENVVRCHEAEGWAEYMPSREEMRGINYPGTRKIYGKVEVIPADGKGRVVSRTFNDDGTVAVEIAFDSRTDPQQARDAVRKGVEVGMAESPADPWTKIGTAENKDDDIMDAVRRFCR